MVPWLTSDNFTLCHTESERGDRNFCLSRSHYTDTYPTCWKWAPGEGIEPTTSSAGVACSNDWATALPFPAGKYRIHLWVQNWAVFQQIFWKLCMNVSYFNCTAKVPVVFFLISWLSCDFPYFSVSTCMFIVLFCYHTKTEQEHQDLFLNNWRKTNYLKYHLNIHSHLPKLLT